jgi:cysteine-rich repeat protein
MMISMRTAFLGLIVPLHLVLAVPATATVANDICAPADDPCVVKVVKNGVPVTPGSTLDFGTRTLRVPPGAQLVVGGTAGSMTIKAGAMDIQATSQGAGALRAVGGDITVTAATGDVGVHRMGNSVARIDVSGDPSTGGGGSIDLEATAGNVLVDGVLDAGANLTGETGGFVTLSGMTVALGAASEIDVDGKGDGGGGTLQIDSDSNLTLGGKIDGSGGFFGGGEIDLSAGGNVVATAKLDLQGTQGGGDGGVLDIEPVGGSVTISGSVNLSGDSDGDFSGNGGELDIETSGSILLTAPVDASSGTGGGGGTIDFTAGFDITQTAPIQVQGKGADGDGGTATFEAHRALIMGDVDATGDQFNSGEIDGTAWCSLSLPAGKTLDTTDGGLNDLQSGGTMTIAGNMRSTNGTNELDYLSTLPVVTGVVNPAATVVQDGTLTPCGGGPPTCGNGQLDAGEPCDGALGHCPISGQQCTPACTCAAPPTCGDGNVDPGEQCDDGNKVNGDGCDNNCTPTACGNGIKTGDEECDDGNMVAGDGCSPSCLVERCGNGELDPGEQCDDGEQGSATCSPPTPPPGPPGCQLMPPETCGNGTSDPGETCDDGNQNDCDGCSRFCLIECGDGKTACAEQCDDGNTASNDGCSATCQLEFCGDHVVQTSEECDDGVQNGVLGDPCSATCTLHWCGDGHVDSGEQCDDANTNVCDGCKNDCTAQTVACPICSAGSTDPCIPCTGAADCDPLRACGSVACSAGVCTPTDPPNCDDGDPCTVDSCDPARGCVRTPKVCEDGDACNGVSTCDPASGACVPGSAPDCDDHDACTDDDRCVNVGTGSQCTTTPRTGAALATCRLDAIDSLLSSPSIKKATRKKMAKLVKTLRKKLPLAAGTGKKAARALKQANSTLLSLTRVVTKAAKKVPPDVVASLRDAISKATSAVASL